MPTCVRPPSTCSTPTFDACSWKTRGGWSASFRKQTSRTPSALDAYKHENHGDRPSAMSTADAVGATRRALVGPLLIAGEDASRMDGALHVAQLLARRDRVNAHVLTVVRPLALPASLFAAVDQDAWAEVRRQQQLA